MDVGTMLVIVFALDTVARRGVRQTHRHFELNFLVFLYGQEAVLRDQCVVSQPFSFEEDRNRP